MSQLFMRRPDLSALPALPELTAGYALRKYHPGDLVSLATLLRAAFEDEAWTTERAAQALPNAPDVTAIFVIARENEIVATASARLHADYPTSGYVHWVAASPTQKGKGLGRAVTLATLHEFARLGRRGAVLETDDFRLAAVKTYLTLGFQPEPRGPEEHERWKQVLEKLGMHARLL